MAGKIAETPLMKQYIEMKGKHPDAILLFRVGDFYETFSNDAIEASEILGITLTRRANGAAQYVELAGFPHHALDAYLPKLVRAGKRVAICEQLEDPKLTKKLVKRGITELVTPGVSINDNVLNHKENNFVAALHFERHSCGISLLDISTGEFLTAEGGTDHIDKLLNSFAPKEILIERGKRDTFTSKFGSKFLIFELEDWIFTSDAARGRLLKHFETKNLKGFGVEHLKLGVIASGAILHYLDITQHTQISHITSLSRVEEEKYVRLDKFTLRSLELLAPMNEGGKSLLDVIDRTLTPMGSRMMRRWLTFPLKEVTAINQRLDVVDHLFRFPDDKCLLEEKMSLIGDLERLTSKVAVGRVTPREMVQLRVALSAIEPIKEICANSQNHVLTLFAKELNLCEEIRNRIEREIQPDAPSLINKGCIIREGVSQELDELRQMSGSGKEYLMHIQQRESEATGIPSLKISYNNVFGYYIEVRNTHKDKVPEEWIRKQTLANAERYITQELKEYEEKILGAKEKSIAREAKIFDEIKQALSQKLPELLQTANAIAALDCLLSLATVAKENRYVKPEILPQGEEMHIVGGRHPVVEAVSREQFVPNDTYLNADSDRTMIITGPNMAGKSTYMRQVALIAILAHMGSFVPAKQAKIPILDKIYTRVGASDNLIFDQSTFMVEMSEVSAILRGSTKNSLLILDEVGRGTSTYDGLSIAWAVVEYITQNVKAKTLFATHYHELTQLEGGMDGVKNYKVTVKESNHSIVFLRKIARGGANKSFGVEVASLAGVPGEVTERAKAILKRLEKKDISSQQEKTDIPVEETEKVTQSLSEEAMKLLRSLKEIDCDELTPRQALTVLSELVETAKEV